MKTKTKEEIQKQIDGLKAMKKWLPEHSTFGDNNWEKIDAKLDILEGKKDADDFYMDEHSEEYEDGDNDTYFEAEKAERWMAGDEKEDLFETE